MAQQSSWTFSSTKICFEVILRDKYNDYKSVLTELNILTLSRRREILCLRFVIKSLKLQNFRKMFPLNILSCMDKRKARRFIENHANTERYLKSSIPYMQSHYVIMTLSLLIIQSNIIIIKTFPRFSLFYGHSIAMARLIEHLSNRQQLVFKNIFLEEDFF